MALEDGFWYRYLKQSRDKYNKGNYKALALANFVSVSSCFQVQNIIWKVTEFKGVGHFEILSSFNSIAISILLPSNEFKLWQPAFA